MAGLQVAVGGNIDDPGLWGLGEEGEEEVGEIEMPDYTDKRSDYDMFYVILDQKMIVIILKKEFY